MECKTVPKDALMIHGYGLVQILGILGDVSVSKLLGFETFPFFRWFRIRYRKILVSKKVSDSVLKIFVIGKSIGFGIGIIWYRKKVSDSVSSLSKVDDKGRSACGAL